MNRRSIRILLAASVLLAGALSLSVIASFPRQTEEVRAEAEETPGSRFYLRELDGCVAVFAAEDAEVPEQVTAIEVASLPVLDRDRLARGIGVSDASELIRLLEDLGS